jgi:prepilin signal peptidase PulO-like enzyme (type II secretory pathway)
VCTDFVPALVKVFFRGAFFFAAAFLPIVFLLVAFFGAVAFFLAAAFFFTGVARDLAFVWAAFLTDFFLPLSFITFAGVFFTALLVAVLPIIASEIQ